jgi:hypothetical protein
MHSGYFRTIDFIKFLLNKYSQCDLTNQSDRDTAISGLVKRIESALKTGGRGRYGVFRCFLSNLLLWKRSDEKKTAPIVYKGRKVPSWSWMAYYGGIDFITNSGLTVPRNEDLRFDTDREAALIVRVRQFEDCRMGQEKEHAIYADSGRVGSLSFDMGANIQFNYCVIVGMRVDENEDPEKTYYILVVLKSHPGRGIKDSEFMCFDVRAEMSIPISFSTSIALRWTKPAGFGPALCTSMRSPAAAGGCLQRCGCAGIPGTEDEGMPLTNT